MRIKVLGMFIVVSTISCLLFGCLNTRYEPVSQNPFLDMDYIDWYRDIDDTGTYNLTRFIDLDVWFSRSIADYDWNDTTFDVYRDDMIICSGLNVDVHENYLTCYYGYTDEGASLVYNALLAPGTYRIAIKDNSGNEIYSSSCIVTAESGEALSQMITGIEILNKQGDQVLVRIDFNSDITPYINTEFFLTAYRDGDSLDNADYQYSIELAKTHMIIVFDPVEDETESILLSVYTGDGILLCEQLV